MLLIKKGDQLSYIQDMVTTLTQAAHETPSGMERYPMSSLHAQLLLDVTELDYHAISITIPDGHTQSAETRDGALLSVDVKNALPCVGATVATMMAYAEYIAGLFIRRNRFMRCWARFKLVMFYRWCICACTRSEHDHTVLSCEYLPKIRSIPYSKQPKSTPPGVYTPQKASIRIAKLKFEWQFPQYPTGKNHRTKKLPTLVRVQKDIRAVDVRLRQPRQSENTVMPDILVSDGSHS